MPALIAADLAAMVRKHQLQSVYIGTDSPKSVEEVKHIWNTLDVRCGQCRQCGLYARGVVLLLTHFFTADMPPSPSPTSHIPIVSIRADPMVDLVVFTLADQFIGNCVSSFTAIAARHRRARGQPYDYWSLVPPPETHSEL